MVNFLYTLIIILGFASTAYALRCYVCSWSTNTDCNDPFEPKKMYNRDCSAVENPDPQNREGPATGCEVIRYNMEREDGFDKNVERQCSWGVSPKNQIDICRKYADKQLAQIEASLPPKTRLIYERCEPCVGNLCNSSTATGIFGATVACLFVLVCMMY